MKKSKRSNTLRKVKYSKRKTKRSNSHHKRNKNKTRRYRARGGNPFYQRDVPKDWNKSTSPGIIKGGIYAEIWNNSLLEINRDYSELKKYFDFAQTKCVKYVDDDQVLCKYWSIYTNYLNKFIDSLVAELKKDDPNFKRSDIPGINLIQPHDTEIIFLNNYLNKTFIEIELSSGTGAWSGALSGKRPYPAGLRNLRSPYFQRLEKENLIKYSNNKPMAYWQSIKTYVSPFGRNYLGRKIEAGKEILDYMELQYLYYKGNEQVDLPTWRRTATAKTDPEAALLINEEVLSLIKNEIDDYTF